MTPFSCTTLRLYVLVLAMIGVGLIAQEAPEPAPAPAGTEAPAEGGGEASGDVAEGGEGAPVEAAPVDPNAWKETRTQAYAEIQEEVKQWMAENFTKAQIVPKLSAGLAKSWPEIDPSWKELDASKKDVPAPAYFQRGDKNDRPGLTRAREELRAELMRQYERDTPPRSDEQLIAEGKKKYPMYRLEDIVPEPGILLRSGLGMNTRVAGRFKAIDPMRVNIGGRWIHRSDMPDDVQALFYETVNAQRVQEYVNHEKLFYAAQQGLWVDGELDEKLPRKWMAAWYVPVKKRPNSHRFINPESWVSRREYMNKLYEESRIQMEKKQTEQMTKQKFEEELQWIYVKEEKDYMPADAYERWQQEQATKVRVEGQVE